MNIAVLDIGGTSIKSGIYRNGKLEEKKETPTEAQLGGAHVMKNAIEILKSYKDFDRIGISTAGQVDSEKGIIRYANSNIPGYTGTDIRVILTSEFGVPVAVENDVNAAALGEAGFGAGREYNDFLCLTYGTGVGGAIVIDKKIYTGSCFSAGEFGAVLVHPEDRNFEEDEFSGCYERYASTTALVRCVQKVFPELDNGRAIFARIDEPEIQELVNEWIDEIVYGLTSLIHIFNPSCIVLGGGVMKQPYIATNLESKLYHNIMPSFRNVRIKTAELGNDAGMLGAVRIAEALP